MRFSFFLVAFKNNLHYYESSASIEDSVTGSGVDLVAK